MVFAELISAQPGAWMIDRSAPSVDGGGLSYADDALPLAVPMAMRHP